MTIKKHKYKLKDGEIKNILKILGINFFMAVKAHYNACMGADDFYKMIGRRLKYQDSEHLAQFLKNELLYHVKEYAQF